MTGRQIELPSDSRDLSDVEWAVIETRLGQILSEEVLEINTIDAISEKERFMSSNIKALSGLIGTLDDVKKAADAAAQRFQGSIGKVQTAIGNMNRFSDDLDKAADDIHSALGQHTNFPPEDEADKSGK